MSLFPFYMQPTYALTPYEVVYYTRPVRYVRRVQHPLAEPFADALGQLSRFSHPEDDDEFLADTPFGKRRASRAAKPFRHPASTLRRSGKYPPRPSAPAPRWASGKIRRGLPETPVRQSPQFRSTHG